MHLCFSEIKDLLFIQDAEQNSSIEKTSAIRLGWRDEQGGTIVNDKVTVAMELPKRSRGEPPLKLELQMYPIRVWRNHGKKSMGVVLWTPEVPDELVKYTEGLSELLPKDATA